MATIAGLASNFDWTTLVDQLIAVSRTSQNRVVAEKSTLAGQSSAIGAIKSLLQGLQTSLDTLREPEALAQRKTVVSGTATATASAIAGTPAGSYDFTIAKLATASSLEGVSKVASAIVPSGDVDSALLSTLNLAQAVTPGNFSVNGVKITVTSADTLGEVFARIESATGVVASYDAAADRVTLSNGGSPVVLGAANDTSTFLSAFKLSNNGTPTITSADTLGATRQNVPIAQAGLEAALTAVDGSGNGSLSINGVAIAYNINTDSLQSVINRINASTAGVAASYDPTRDRFVLTNKVTGDLAIGLSEPAGGLLAALGLDRPGATAISGQNAELVFNGGQTIISSTNAIGPAQLGIAGLSLALTGPGAGRVSVTNDSATSRAKIDDFIARYNAVQNAIEAQTRIVATGTTVTAGTLANNREINELERTLRAIVFSSSPDNPGAVKRLTDLGIDFAGAQSTLTIKDPAKLDALLADPESGVSTFFTSPTGFGKRLDDALERQVGLNGRLDVQTTNLSRQSQSLDQQIATMERRLAAQRAALEASFTQMETAQAFYKQQEQALTNAFGLDRSNT